VCRSLGPITSSTAHSHACHDGLDLTRFSCGDQTLDRWITKESKTHNQKNFVRVFCAHRPDSSTVIELYALSLIYETTDKLLESEKHLVVNSRNFPAIFIRCLAVARHFQRKGLGTFLLMNALIMAYNVSKDVSVFGVALTSLNENTTRLYQRYGFAVRDEGHNPTMILPIWSLWDLVEGAQQNPS
jgi:GNAT superfamily N-acetyltransferase